MDIKGKRAFVSGAARRLGREIVLHLARRGCDVIAHYNHSTTEAMSLRTESGCMLFQENFAKAKIDHLTERLQNEVGNIDILINNASSFQKSRWEEISEELWDQEFAVNLKTPFFLASYFGKQMKRRGAGKIINMIDIAAYRPYLNYLPYSLAKAGLIGVTHALARALAPEVQVNAIAPGTILFVEGLSEESKQKIIEKIPAQRTAEIREFLQTIDFLLSNVDFLTGQTIILDGGRSLTW